MECEELSILQRVPAGIKPRGSRFLSSLEVAGEAFSLLTCAVSLLVLAVLTCTGLPKKAPRHPSVQDGLPRGLLLFLGLVYASVHFTTDQYVPNLPMMERDLGSSQSLMSGTVQVNIFVRGLVGAATASLSDRVGRKPILLLCSTCLMLGSLLSGCAQSMHWFILSQILQGIGSSVEPVVLAIAIDHISMLVSVLVGVK